MLPEFDNSALASKLSLHIGGAGVQNCHLPSLLDVGLPARLLSSDSLDAGSVVVVQGTGGASEVGHSVVQPLPINVVNLGGGLLPVMEEPSKAVGENLLASEGDVPIAVSGDSACLTTDDGIPVNLFDPSESACRRAVFKVLAGFLWDNCVSHFKLPLDLVRGVGIAVPTTPIIHF